jgi:NADH-quinone oxidoreductase subunit G
MANVKITINGKQLETESGRTIIQAARENGISIPHFCWHEKLSTSGNCRICLVEVEKMPKLAIACSTQVADGMVVRTANERVKEARDAIMEFLLINHPLDCPICDQAGECRLQQYSFGYGSGGSRFLEEKTHKPKNVDIGRHIVFDAERCILCTRCVRFCQEITKTSELTVSYRGDHATIETYPGMRLDNPYSGNTADICPVGALTVKEFRFRQRVWFLKEVPSICAGCARGCNVLDGISARKILRIVPRENLAVNNWWICDEGRLSYQGLYGAGRILRPRVAHRAGVPPGSPAGDLQGGSIVPFMPTMNEGIAPAPRTDGDRMAGETVMPLALDAAAAALEAASAQGGGGAVEFLLSARATNEDIYLFAKLARDRFGAKRVALPAHVRGEDDNILIRADRTPNRAGALAILDGLGLGVENGSDLLLRVGAGGVRAVVALGPNLVGPDVPDQAADGMQAGGAAGLFEALGVAAEAAGTLLVVIDAFESPLTARAGIVLPALTYGEIEGTYTNFQGRVQRVRAGLAPGADGLPAYRIAQELARRLGDEPGPTGAQEIFTALAAGIGAFAGLSYARLGDGGAPLATKAGAA